MHYAVSKHRMITFLVISMALLLPRGIKAQSESVSNPALYELCLIQNWETSSTQRWLKAMSKKERMTLYGVLPFSSQVKHCLFTKKPASTGVCDKAIAMFDDFRQRVPLENAKPLKELTEEDENKLWAAFSGSNCKIDDRSESPDPWVPKDVQPDASITKLLELAKNGDIKAQMAAHSLYLAGVEIPGSEAKANYWLSRAASAGNADAQYLLGWKYSIGQIAPVNFPEAIRLLTQAANQGHSGGMTELARIYREPAESDIAYAPKKYWNMKKAMELYLKAANLGDPNAIMLLARIYGQIGPVPLDLKKSLFWREKSAQNNSAYSMRILSELYQVGKGTPRDAKVAQQWRRRADALGENGAGLYLIDYFAWGDPPADTSAISKIQLKHANAGDIDAQLAIASRYSTGNGLTKDEGIALSWWKRAAATGDPIGQRMLGKRLINSEQAHSLDANSPGIGWLQKAVAQGDMAAQVELAYWNLHGRAGNNNKQAQRRNLMEAIRLMQEAAERGYNPEDSFDRVEKWKNELVQE